MTINTISPNETDQVKINGLIKRIIELWNGVSDFTITLLALTTAAAWRTALGVRDVLSANRDYYVRTDGSDSNTGLANTAGAAFLTIQKAINVAASLDLSIYAVTINIADGTYTGAVSLKSFTGVGPITLLGNTGTPANVLLSVTSSPVITAAQVAGPYAINGMKLQANTSGHICLIASQLSQVSYKNIVFSAANIHLGATYDAQLIANGPTTTTGNFNIHWYVDTGGVIQDAGQTITIGGTPAIGQAFGFAIQHGRLIVNQNTFSGTATGVRYHVAQLGLINTNNAGDAYLPGNAIEFPPTSTGGQYT